MQGSKKNIELRKNYVSDAPWFSSYEKNNYGDLFYSLIKIYKPLKVVELGTKAGYSAYHMARGLKENRKGTLDCYDLWEQYPFRSVSKNVAEKNLKKFKNIINLTLEDAANIHKKYKSVDILHVDLSNHGEILGSIIPHWISKVNQLIIIEGGSAERDKLDWMIKYKKKSIKNWVNKFSAKYKVECFTFEPFPSITLICKK